MARTQVQVLDKNTGCMMIDFFVDHLTGDAEPIYDKLSACKSLEQLLVELNKLVFSNKPGLFVDTEIVLEF